MAVLLVRHRPISTELWRSLSVARRNNIGKTSVTRYVHKNYALNTSRKNKIYGEINKDYI